MLYILAFMRFMGGHAHRNQQSQARQENILATGSK